MSMLLFLSLSLSLLSKSLLSLSTQWHAPCRYRCDVAEGCQCRCDFLAGILFGQDRGQLRRKNPDTDEFGTDEFDPAKFDVIEVAWSRLAPLLQVGHASSA